MRIRLQPLAAIVVVVCTAWTVAAGEPSSNTQPANDWFARIRPDHPRMFFTTETWPQVQAYVREHEATYFDRLCRTVAAIPAQPDPDRCESGSNKMYGPYAQISAFVWRMTGDADALTKARNYLLAGVEFYNRRSSKRQPVSWYSASRVCALTAYDWIYDQLSPTERKQVASGFFGHYRDCLAGKRFNGQNRSNHTSGFYGPTNMAWYVGLAFHRDGVDDAQAARLLKRGYDEHLRLLRYRSQAAGDDGGMGTIAAGYAFGMYPWSEFNFMHTYNSATGLAMEDSFDHMSLLPVWVHWNILPGRGRFGMGDSSPGGTFSDGFLEMHMLQTAHFYADRYPRRAQLALWVRNQQLASQKHDNYWWPVAPLLVTRCGSLPAPTGPGDNAPMARNFEAMGVTFMRGGSDEDDVQAMFVNGGSVLGHRHYDQGHFAIYRGEHLTGNSGHYGGRSRNDHLTEYFYRTVAANSLLIHAPANADRPAVVWGGAAKTLDGGQCRYAGRQIAFETRDKYDYAAVDMTASYANTKCRQAIRQFVFVRPDTFVIFDRVVTPRPEFSKTWLLHSIDKPIVDTDGRTFRLNGETDSLIGRTLLPDDATPNLVGGKGREFFSAGGNHPQDGPPRRDAGAWRLEVSPKRSTASESFLHILRVGDSGVEFGEDIERLLTATTAGVRFTGADGAKVSVLFNRRGRVGGQVRIEGDEPIRRPLAVTVQPQESLADREKSAP